MAMVIYQLIKEQIGMKLKMQSWLIIILKAAVMIIEVTI